MCAIGPPQERRETGSPRDRQAHLGTDTGGALRDILEVREWSS